MLKNEMSTNFLLFFIINWGTDTTPIFFTYKFFYLNVTATNFTLKLLFPSFLHFFTFLSKLTVNTPTQGPMEPQKCLGIKERAE
jgi:hypothetical protein